MDTEATANLEILKNMFPMKDQEALKRLFILKQMNMQTTLEELLEEASVSPSVSQTHTHVVVEQPKPLVPPPEIQHHDTPTVVYQPLAPFIPQQEVTAPVSPPPNQHLEFNPLATNPMSMSFITKSAFLDKEKLDQIRNLQGTLETMYQTSFESLEAKLHNQNQQIENMQKEMAEQSSLIARLNSQVHQLGEEKKAVTRERDEYLKKLQEPDPTQILDDSVEHFRKKFVNSFKTSFSYVACLLRIVLTPQPWCSPWWAC